MTLFQARFIQWLTLNQCSIRATAGNYDARYNADGSQKTVKEIYKGYGGNQVDGMLLRDKAIEVLEENNIEPFFDTMGTDIEDYDTWRKEEK